MSRCSWSVPLVLVMMTAVACTAADAPACAPGRVEACPCGGGVEGRQACLPDGRNYGACECPEFDAGADDGGAPLDAPARDASDSLDGSDADLDAPTAPDAPLDTGDAADASLDGPAEQDAPADAPAPDASACASSSDCDDGVPCTDDRCDGSGACMFVPVHARCSSGTCNPTGCACATLADCDDGVFCNGAERCDPEFGCRPATSPRSCSDGNSCSIDRCDGALDMCVFECDRGTAACATDPICA